MSSRESIESINKREENKPDSRRPLTDDQRQMLDDLFHTVAQELEKTRRAIPRKATGKLSEDDTLIDLHENPAKDEAKPPLNTWGPQFLLIPFLLWALYPGNPYLYYIFLRVFCFAGAALIIVFSFYYDAPFWLKFSFFIMAMIYNPSAWMALGRPVWSVVNIATAILLIVSIFVFIKTWKKDQQEEI